MGSFDLVTCNLPQTSRQRKARSTAAPLRVRGVIPRDLDTLPRGCREHGLEIVRLRRQVCGFETAIDPGLLDSRFCDPDTAAEDGPAAGEPDPLHGLPLRGHRFAGDRGAGSASEIEVVLTGNQETGSTVIPSWSATSPSEMRTTSGAGEVIRYRGSRSASQIFNVRSRRQARLGSHVVLDTEGALAVSAARSIKVEPGRDRDVATRVGVFTRRSAESRTAARIMWRQHAAPWERAHECDAHH